jgi:hypothetical protein
LVVLRYRCVGSRPVRGGQATPAVERLRGGIGRYLV